MVTLGTTVFATSTVAGQDIHLTGIVRDSTTTESLPNATVTVVGTGIGAVTDEFGRFAIVGLGAGEYLLRVEYLGYQTYEHPLVGPIDVPMSVLLVPAAVEVEGVTVRARSEIVEMGDNLSEIRFNPQQLSALPSLGEPDVFRGLQLLPGVGGTSDATSGLFVRGGTPDENLVLLDGMTVYHVDHFFGVFSAFNSDAIKDVRLYKGGFPAEFGGRTSSVVELIGKTGDTEEFNVSGGMNLLSMSAVAEIPLSSRGSWLISARRSYTDLIRSPLYNGIFGTLEGAEDTQSGPGPGAIGGRGGRRFNQQSTSPSFFFYDLNSKVTFTPSAADVLAVSVYSGQDNLDESTPATTIVGFDGTPAVIPDRADLTEWGNRGVSGRWSRQWGPRFTSDALVAYTEYFSDGISNVAATQGARGFNEHNNVKDFTLRIDNEWKPFAFSTVGFGALRTESDVGYDFELLNGESVTRELDLSSAATQTALYVEHDWKPIAWFTLTAGLRSTAYDGTSETYWEPRASTRIDLSDRLALKGAWGQYNQFVKRIENEDILEGSRDFWVLADTLVPPQSAEHQIAGLSYETPDLLFEVEGYRKSLDGVSQFSTRVRTGPVEEAEQLFFSGVGKASGVEFLAQKKSGDLTGWVSYTLSRVEYDLDGFNSGDPFPASHDQRHEFKTVATYRLGLWTLGGTWVYGSGTPYTIPEAVYPITAIDGREFQYIHVGEKNGQRLPAYHRLDVSATRRFESARFAYDLNLSLFNAYGRDNVWYRQFDLSQSPLLVTDISTLGFTPSVGLKIALK